jgi:spore maturation protein CgeB
MLLRKYLLQFGLIWHLNAAWKSRQVRQRYRYTLNYYHKKFPDEDIKSIANRASVLIGDPDRRLKVLWVGTDVGQDFAGLLQGLEKVANIVLFTTPDGKYGQYDALGRTQETEREQNGKILLDLAVDHQRGVPKVDIVMGQMWGYRMDTSALDQIRANKIPVVNISMDDRHAYWGKWLRGAMWGGTHGVIGHIDLACTAAPEVVNWYHAESCPAIFLPEASDPDFFKPYPDLSKKYDVCFVGQRYGIRDEIVRRLRKAGLNVIAFGSGWTEGHLPTEEVPRLFAQSRIVLGIGTILYCRDFYALKMRDFDGPMSGSFYLTHANPDLNQLYDVGKDIMVYQNVEECIELAKYYCNHDLERETIAQNGRRKAELDHTWEARFRIIISKLRELNYS